MNSNCKSLVDRCEWKNLYNLKSDEELYRDYRDYRVLYVVINISFICLSLFNLASVFDNVALRVNYNFLVILTFCSLLNLRFIINKGYYIHKAFLYKALNNCITTDNGNVSDDLYEAICCCDTKVNILVTILDVLVALTTIVTIALCLLSLIARKRYINCLWILGVVDVFTLYLFSVLYSSHVKIKLIN